MFHNYTCDLFYEINKSYTCLLNTIRAINISLFATNKSSDKLFSDESHVRLLYIIQYHIPTSPSQLTAKWKNILCQLQSLKILFWKDNTYLTGTEMMGLFEDIFLQSYLYRYSANKLQVFFQTVFRKFLKILTGKC